METAYTHPSCRLAPGVARTSHACECAEHFGVPSSVVNRAQYISNSLTTFNIAAILDQAMTQEDVDELEAAEKIARRFIEWDLAEGVNNVMEKLNTIMAED